MGEYSKIEWTHHTFNPWIGCTKVSAACDNCYAETWDSRFGGDRWGPHAVRTRTSMRNWNQPAKWNKQALAAGERRRVFCASLADIFDNHKSIRDGWRDDLWRIIRETPQLDWLLLTKRPQNIPKFIPNDWGTEGYPNVWLGATVEDQDQFYTRVPPLTDVPAAKHFLSMEPLLESVYIGSHAHMIDWIITGGESGPNFRHADPEWFIYLRDQCHEWDIKFLFKQWEGVSQSAIKKLGRELDGEIHDGYPI